MDNQQGKSTEPYTVTKWFNSAVSYVLPSSQNEENVKKAVQTSSPSLEPEREQFLMASSSSRGAVKTSNEDRLMCLSATYLHTNATTHSLITQSDSLLDGASPSTLPAMNFPPEYSLQGIFVPTNVEDWSAFAASLPDNAFPRYKMILPKKSKILALDLDETLVHSTSRSSSDCDFFIEVLVDRSSCLYYVFKRPFVDQFLETVLQFLM